MQLGQELSLGLCRGMLGMSGIWVIGCELWEPWPVLAMALISSFMKKYLLSTYWMP